MTFSTDFYIVEKSVWKGLHIFFCRRVSFYEAKAFFKIVYNIGGVSDCGTALRVQRACGERHKRRGEPFLRGKLRFRSKRSRGAGAGTGAGACEAGDNSFRKRGSAGQLYAC